MSTQAHSANSNGSLVNIIFWLLLTVMAVSGLMGLAGALGALIEHHVWLLHGNSFLFSGVGPLEHPSNPASGWADAHVRSQLPGPIVWWFLMLLLLALGIGAAYGLYRWARPTTLAGSAQRGHNGVGMASRREIRDALGPKSAREGAKQTRPSAGPNAPISDVSLDWGRDVHTGKRLHGSLESTAIIIGAQGSGKSSALFIPGLLSYPGSALATSTRADLYQCTASLRAERGPVYVLDPTGVLPLGSMGLVGWSIQDGCADPKTAIRRGRNMAAASSAGVGVTNAAHWQDSCAEVLRCYLHAAAMGGYSAAHIDQWAAHPGDDEPTRALELPGAVPGWSRKFQALQNLEPEERSGVWSCVRRALDFLADPTVLATCSPGPGMPALNLARFVDEHATLYIIGSENDQSVLRPLVVALVDAVTSAARERARATPGRRPDPPVGIFLDECPQIAPLPNLPQLASTARGDGITLYIGCQSAGQLLDIYGAGGRATLMDAATALLVLPGLTDARYAEEVSKLCGEREQEVWSWTDSHDGRRSQTRSLRTVPVISAPDVRSLKAWHAILLHRGMKPIETKLTPWFRRGDLAPAVTSDVAPARSATSTQ